jgi:hypothetical protein
MAYCSAFIPQISSSLPRPLHLQLLSNLLPHKLSIPTVAKELILDYRPATLKIRDLRADKNRRAKKWATDESSLAFWLCLL